jgi:hypothetical protein
MRSSMLPIAALAGMALPVSPMEPGAEPEPGSARNRPSGSRPIPGGGARERARRLARLTNPETES